VPRIAHVSLSDIEGGAARAAYRLHRSLLKTGAASEMQVIRKTLDDPTVVAPLGNIGRTVDVAADLLSRQILKLQKTSNPVRRSANWLGVGLGRRIDYSRFDAVNLHWIGAETLSIREVASIRAPLVWTLHDMWPFCGTEHYDDLDAPGRYRNGYSSNMPQASRHPDLDRWTYRLKKRRWHHLNLHLVCPSAWMAQTVAQSELFGSLPRRVIPNGIDLDIYRPIERREARDALDLPQHSRLILFGAVSGTSDRRKGFHLLQEAVARFGDAWRSEHDAVVVFGASSSSARALSAQFNVRVYTIGHIADETQLAKLYSCADVFVAPSMQDNLPNTLVEAHACGTPCVGFDVGGVGEIIRHGVTGYLARPFDPADLSNAIARTLSLPVAAARDACRKHAIERFSDRRMAQEYLQFYALAQADHRANRAVRGTQT
jgi:glycosyltransferase involved in cell wall biosynthesis